MEALKDILEAAAKQTGVEMRQSAAEVAVYTATMAAKLGAAVGQPGFPEAVQAARDAVALYAGMKAVGQADAADARILGIIEGVRLPEAAEARMLGIIEGAIAAGAAALGGA